MLTGEGSGVWSNAEDMASCQVGGRWSRQGGMIESRMRRLRASEEGIALQTRRKRKQGGRKRKVGKGETEELEVDGGECC